MKKKLKESKVIKTSFGEFKKQSKINSDKFNYFGAKR